MKKFGLAMVLIGGMSVGIEAKTVKIFSIDRGVYLKISSDARIVFVADQNEATIFTMAPAGQLGLFGGHDGKKYHEQVLFVSSSDLSDFAEDKFLYLGCDSTSALTLFSLPLKKETILWENGASELILALGEIHLRAEPVYPIFSVIFPIMEHGESIPVYRHNES